MDCGKIGKLIADSRKEKQMTQKDVADKLNISDKTISKWERGLGCPSSIFFEFLIIKLFKKVHMPTNY